VNVSSIEAFRAAPDYAVYAACKAGMVNFTRTMALELGSHGIRVNGIAPDHTITPGLRGNRAGPVDPASWPEESPEDIERMARLIPVGREGLVEECAAAVVWLCSAMSSYVTGETVSVDGGTRAGGGWSRRPDGGWALIS
jgi:NAD(P)-dependent dehydrogenase (short-subunit alcohol dehydrogenase family)